MRGRIITGLMAAMFAASPALAQAEEDTPAIQISYNAAIVSDYRFRGLSLSNREPAIQGGIDAVARSGWFVGTWASTIADYGGANVEVDFYGGYAGSVAGLDYSASVLGYVYPDGKDVDYIELQSTLGKTIGPVTTTLTLAYIPDQWNTAGDNFYASLGADVAIIGTPLTASFSAGRETGGYDNKWDWSAGVAYRFDVLEISASYVDSNYGGALEAGRNGRAGAVLSVKASF